MRTHVRVVVVGGGILGASTLYHLAKLGINDALLIEKGELTSGITWHATGMVGHVVATPLTARINRYATDLYKNIEAETGQSVTWHASGSLTTAYSMDHLEWLRSMISIGRPLDLSMEIVTPSEAAKLHPFLNTEGLLGALHTPDDGHLDPSGACHAFAAGARQMGSEIVRFNRVTNLAQCPSGEWLVSTEKGEVTCEHVVLAAGTFARQIGKWIGLDIPLVSIAHQYLVTESIPEFSRLEREPPVIRDDERVSGYIRLEQKSGLIGVHERTNIHNVWDNGTPWESQNELFEPDIERMLPWLQNAMERMPVLANAGIRRVVHGAIAYAPDGKMLVGPAPGLRNFWICGGAVSGIASAPAIGKSLAEWIAAGAPELDMRIFDPRRFGRQVDRGWQMAKAKDYFIRRHQTPLPGELSRVGRDLRISGLHDRLLQAGGDHEPVFGWERPRWFAPASGGDTEYSFRRGSWFTLVARECSAVATGAILVDQSAGARFELEGADVPSLLSRLVATALPPSDGIATSALLATEAGTLELDASIARLARTHFFIMTAAAAEERLADWIDLNCRPGEDVRLQRLGESHGTLLLAGAQADAVIAAAFGSRAEAILAMPPNAMLETSISSLSVRVQRNLSTGESGWTFVVAMTGLADLHAALWKAGTPHGIANAGSYAMRSLALEMAAKGPAEMNHALTFAQSGLIDRVDFARGGFIGQLALSRQAADPGSTRIALLALEDGDCDCAGGEAVYRDEMIVGTVTSGGFGHRTGTSLAFALLQDNATRHGTILNVLVMGNRRAARIVSGSVYRTDRLEP